MTKRNILRQDADRILGKMRKELKAALKKHMSAENKTDFFVLNHLLRKRGTTLLKQKPRAVWIRVISEGESKWGKPSWIAEINTEGQAYLAIILPMYQGAKPYVTDRRLWLREIKEGQEVLVGYRTAKMVGDGILEEVVD